MYIITLKIQRYCCYHFGSLPESFALLEIGIKYRMLASIGLIQVVCLGLNIFDFVDDIYSHPFLNISTRVFIPLSLFAYLYFGWLPIKQLLS
jgi:hypothetical protein